MRAPNTYSVLRRDAPVVGPGHWELVASPPTRARVADELASRLGWRAGHGDLVRVLLPGGEDDALYFFDGASDSFRKAMRPPQVYRRTPNPLSWPQFWEERPVDLFSLTYAGQGVDWRHLALATSAAFRAFAVGQAASAVFDRAEASELSGVARAVGDAARGVATPEETEDAAFFANRNERAAVQLFHDTAREFGALTDAARTARCRMVAWGAAVGLLRISRASAYPYIGVQVVADYMLDVLATVSSAPPSAHRTPPGADELAGIFRRAIPLSVVVAARSGLRDPAPVAWQKPNGRRARRGGGR